MIKTESDMQIKKISKLLDEADKVLIGAGSGLSADAGINYFDKVLFAEKYPAMLQYGFTCNMDLMGYDQLTDPELFWGYYLNHGNLVRFSNSDQQVYKLLFEIVSEKDYFVITTNVDSLFKRNGFEENRIYTPQGDYGRIQCKRPCSDQTWFSEPLIEGLLPMVDHLTGKLPGKLIPTCPNCGGPVFYNIRGGNWFIDSPYEEQLLKYRNWIEKSRRKTMLLIEIGAGFNTPMWIRWPFEEITERKPDSSLIRINPDEPEIPESIAGRSLSIRQRACKVIDSVFNNKK